MHMVLRNNRTFLAVPLMLTVYETVSSSVSKAQNSSDNNNNSCSMTGLLGILIQVALGALSFSVLVVKRYREKPKRPWRIWVFDTSKQVISQLIAHFINLTISLALSYDRQNSDECLWYFVTNILDNTIGVLISVFGLKLVESYIRKRNKLELISGNYYKIVDKSSEEDNNRTRNIEKGKALEEELNADLESPERVLAHKAHREGLLNENNDSRVRAVIELHNKYEADPTKEGLDRTEFREGPFIENSNEQSEQASGKTYVVDYRAWVLQLCIWNGIVIVAKSVLFGIEYGLKKQLQELSIFVLGWIEAYPVLELVVVIVIVPVIMNGLAFWVQDNFLMKKEKNIEEKSLVDENRREERKRYSKGDEVIFEEFQNNGDATQNQAELRRRRRSTIGMDRYEFHEEFNYDDQPGNTGDKNLNKEFQYFDRFRTDKGEFGL